ncbi:MAG: hypothetical protein ACYDA2_02100 [Acidimicrobiales bacterium]
MSDKAPPIDADGWLLVLNHDGRVRIAADGSVFVSCPGQSTSGWYSDPVTKDAFSGETPGIDAWVEEEGEEAVASAVEAARQEIADGRAFEFIKSGDVQALAGRARHRPA